MTKRTTTSRTGRPSSVSTTTEKSSSSQRRGSKSASRPSAPKSARR